MLKGAHSPSKICNNMNIKKDSSDRPILFLKTHISVEKKEKLYTYI